MIAALVKKDFILLLRNKFLTTVLMLAFLLVVIGINLGLAAYYMMMLAGIWQLLLTVETIEKKTGADALLYVTPYMRGNVVSGRYVSAMAFFVLLTLGYCVISLPSLSLPNWLPLPNALTIATGFLAAALFIAITLPLYMKFSEFTVRLISLAMILGGGFVILGSMEVLITLISGMDEWVLIALCIAVGVGALAISRTVAVNMARRREY